MQRRTGRAGSGDPVATIYARMMRGHSLVTSTFQRRCFSVSCRPPRHSLSLPLLSYGQLTFCHVPKVRVSPEETSRGLRGRAELNLVVAVHSSSSFLPSRPCSSTSLLRKFVLRAQPQSLGPLPRETPLRLTSVGFRSPMSTMEETRWLTRLTRHRSDQ